MEGLDMAGPAAYFRAQGVNGNDLMNFESAGHLRNDLGTTPFLARKVVALRNEHAALPA